METTNLTGNIDISLWDTNVTDLTKNKTFDGGSMSITSSGQFSIDAPVYEEEEDAYTNTEGTTEWKWIPRLETTEPVYLGTLTYFNELEKPRDSSIAAVGSSLDITLDTPDQGTLVGQGVKSLPANLYFDIGFDPNGPETLTVTLRGADPNNFDFTSRDGETVGVIPYRFDFLGGLTSGSDAKPNSSFTVTVGDDSSVSIDLYGRFFALDNGDLPINNSGDTGSEGSTPIDTGENEPDTEIENGGTDSEADDSGDTDIPVNTGTDTDSPDTEGGTEDGTGSEPDDTATDEPTIQDTITALQDQIDGLQPLVDQGIISQEVLDDLESQVEELLDIANGDSGTTLTSPEDIPTLPPTIDSEDSDSDSDSVSEIEDNTPPVVAFPTPETVADGSDSNDSTVESPDETSPVVSSGDESLLSNDFDSGSELSIDSISTEQIDPLESTDVTTEVVTVSGSGIPNQEVDLTVIGVYSDALTTTTDLDGNWSIELPVPLIDGVYELIATQPTLDGRGQLNDLEKLTIDTDFDIEFKFSEEVEKNKKLKGQIEDAGEFWEDVIVGGLPNAGEIDDIELTVFLADYGDPNKLAEGNSTLYREDANKLPYQGALGINIATLNGSVADDLVVDAIKHEIAHALGMNKRNYAENRRDLVVGVGKSLVLSENPRFVGKNAAREYRELSGILTDDDLVSVPLEENGAFMVGASSISHWDEDALGDELMTPKTNKRKAFLSTITIGALNDLGYKVDYSQAENFEARKPNIKIESSVPALTSGEILTVDITVTDESGIREVGGLFDLDNDGNLDPLNVSNLGSDRYRLSSTVGISGDIDTIPFQPNERTLTIIAQDNFGITETFNSSIFTSSGIV